MPKKRRRTIPTDEELYPEPGRWVVSPDCWPIPRGPISAQEVYLAVVHEGLGHCVYELIPRRRIKDPKLRQLWGEARASMQRIVEYLESTSMHYKVETLDEEPDFALEAEEVEL